MGNSFYESLATHLRSQRKLGESCLFASLFVFRIEVSLGEFDWLEPRGGWEVRHKSLKWGTLVSKQNGEGSDGRQRLRGWSSFLESVTFCLPPAANAWFLPICPVCTYGLDYLPGTWQQAAHGPICQITLATYSATHFLVLFHPHASQALGSQASQKKEETLLV